MPPDSIKAPFRDHLGGVKRLHKAGRRLAAHGSTRRPGTEVPNAPAVWSGHWVFPQKDRRRNRRTGEGGQHHVHETLAQRGVRGAVSEVGIAKRAGCRPFRHAFATQLFEAGYDVRII